MKRTLSVAILLLMSSIQAMAQRYANNVLVLIQPALAGPRVDPLNYWQPQWVLWPPAVQNANGGRLLSVSSGADWVGDSRDFQFEVQKDGHSWRARNFDAMVDRGHFAVRYASFGVLGVGLLSDSSDSVSPNALRLALNPNSPVVRMHRIHDLDWPVADLMIMEASSWDEIADLERWTRGRILVVEYPPQEDVPWTRYWLKGGGWSISGIDLKLSSDSAIVPTQKGSQVPGLIRARMLIPLVMNPDRFVVSNVTVKNWPGANRFLTVSHSYGLLIGAIWILSIVGIVIWGAVLVANERESHIVPVLMVGAFLSPASVNLAGVLGRYLGADAWPIWIGLSSVTVVMLAFGVGALVKSLLPRSHPLFSVCAVGFIVMVSCNPVWSVMSPLFSGRNLLLSPVALGATFGYLVGVGCFLRGSGAHWIWLPRLLSIAFLAIGCGYRLWWASDLNATLFISVASWVISEDLFQWPVIVAFGFWPTSLLPIIAGGFTWAPLGLLYRGGDLVGLNTAEYVDFLLSVSLWICVTVFLWVALFGYQFFFYQLRKLARMDARRKMLPYAAVSSVAFGLLHPIFLMASLSVTVGAGCALLFDAVQAM